MNLTFKEKSLWLMLIGLIVFSFFYSYTVSHTYQAAQADVSWFEMKVMPQMIALFVVAIVLELLISVVGHIVMAVLDQRTDEDERDKLIELKGERVGGYILATGVFISLCLAVISNGNFLFTHVLLAFWVLAQMSTYATQLFIYRKEA
jgi:hypothetical protein